MNSRLFLAAAICLAMLASCDKDDDDDNNSNIVERSGLSISGAQEVPERPTTATGTMDVRYDKNSKTLNFTVNWQGLTAIPTGSHIHGPAARGANAGVKFDFTTPLPKTTSGTYTGSTVIGTAIKEDSLLNGFYYVNIHTSTYPGGEIRGQIEF